MAVSEQHRRSACRGNAEHGNEQIAHYGQPQSAGRQHCVIDQRALACDFHIRFIIEIHRLDDGDIIIMMTDGISEAGFGTVRTDWLKKEIKMPFDTMDEMAQSVIENAVKKRRDAVIDDMTVATIRLIRN